MCRIPWAKAGGKIRPQLLTLLAVGPLCSRDSNYMYTRVLFCFRHWGLATRSRTASCAESRRNRPQIEPKYQGKDWLPVFTSAGHGALISLPCHLVPCFGSSVSSSWGLQSRRLSIGPALQRSSTLISSWRAQALSPLSLGGRCCVSSFVILLPLDWFFPPFVFVFRLSSQLSIPPLRFL
ncbi:hypothetical protein BT67DRAFT_252775 [Trichocladium antarcticum]|uniref:Secreted protein n=1 Tax=Trichocladium antarcticum TaxID=1450529 RepID=A0AAN6ZA42_9PEZI|nr:hypothetical protein BT67DRAFT_252775 [Trichocladium antarcticum]